MHEKVSFNRQILSASDAMVSAVSNVAIYGKGAFTTISIDDGEPLLLEKHWIRLVGNAAKLEIDIADFSENHTKNLLDELLENNGVTNGLARITFFDESASAIWKFESARTTSLLITTGDLRPVPIPFRLTTSPFPVNSLSPLAGVKSCNYLENLLGIEEARSRGFHEALRINHEGALTGGCMANVFWLKRGVLFTPHLDTGCLPGTTREYILENLPCEQTREPIDTLTDVEAIFMTSAGLGVVQVHDLDGRSFATVDHPILHLLPDRR